MTTLIESKAKPFGSSKGMIISMVLHGGLIGGALYGTAQVMLPPREKFEAHPVLYVATPPPKPIQLEPEPLPPVKEPPKAKVASPKVFQAPKPKPAAPVKVAPTPAPPVPTIVAPTKIALSLPAVEMKTAPITDVITSAPPEPARAPAGSGTGTAKSSDDAAGGSKGGLNSGASGKAYDENQVDRTVVATREPSPIYPAALRSVNVEGVVVMSFIVSAEGRVEPGSIKVVSTPHRLFADAVRQALLNTRYRAAESNGNAVRQLVEQSFTFRLDKQ